MNSVDQQGSLNAPNSLRGGQTAPAIEGGTPIRREVLPYGRQKISDEDVSQVVQTLRSGWLTTGPKVSEFESVVSDFCGVPYACAVTNGTAALHAAMHAAGIGPGDEVIVPSMTFAATANAVVYLGGRPVFVDVLANSLLIDPAEVERKISRQTKAVIAVDYTGHPCDYTELNRICRKHGLLLIADAAHSLGASFEGRKVGSLADLSIFSFHPVKHVTTGEGGMIVTAHQHFHEKTRRFRNHGMTNEHRQREERNTWEYDMLDLGYNLRLSDISCALGISQMGNLPQWVKRRQEIANDYRVGLSKLPAFRPLNVSQNVDHAFHLFVVQCDLDILSTSRDWVFRALRAEGIGVNVHYKPVHLHTYYREQFGTKLGDCPNAEAAFTNILSLPMFPDMTDKDVGDVLLALKKISDHCHNIS